MRHARKAPRLRVHVSFVEDLVTRVAYLWNTVLGGYHVNLRCANVGEMVDAIRAAVDRHGPGAAVHSIDVAGHGYPGGWFVGLDGSDVTEPAGSERRARWDRLAELRTLWAPDCASMTLLMCETAQGEAGKQFLAALAEQIGAPVRGWTGCYEILPTGREVTALPDGRVAPSGDTGRRLQLVYRHQGKPRLRRWLGLPWEGLQWTGRALDLW
jgi:hypothetical protein